MSCLENTAKDPIFMGTLSAQLILLTFHASVLACILRRRGKGPSSFRSGFFTIYVMQSTADIGCFIVNMLFFRLPQMGCVSQAALDFTRNVGYVLATYCANVLLVAHSAIGINRFLVLTDAWTEHKKRISVISILLLSMPTALWRLIGGTRLVETSVPGVYSVVRDVPWAAVVATLLLYNITLVVTVVFELLALLRYKRLTAKAKEKYRNDFRLLLYALLQFCLQFNSAVTYGIFAIGALAGDFQLVSVVQHAMNATLIALCLSPPLCLISTSKVLRNAWLEMYYPFANRGGTTSPVIVVKPIG